LRICPMGSCSDHLYSTSLLMHFGHGVVIEKESTILVTRDNAFLSLLSESSFPFSFDTRIATSHIKNSTPTLLPYAWFPPIFTSLLPFFPFLSFPFLLSFCLTSMVGDHFGRALLLACLRRRIDACALFVRRRLAVCCCAADLLRDHSEALTDGLSCPLFLFPLLSSIRYL
jgi:hypothetical protein